MERRSNKPQNSFKPWSNPDNNVILFSSAKLERGKVGVEEMFATGRGLFMKFKEKKAISIIQKFKVKQRVRM